MCVCVRARGCECVCVQEGVNGCVCVRSQEGVMVCVCACKKVWMGACVCAGVRGWESTASPPLNKAFLKFGFRHWTFWHLEINSKRSIRIRATLWPLQIILELWVTVRTSFHLVCPYYEERRRDLKLRSWGKWATAVPSLKTPTTIVLTSLQMTLRQTNLINPTNWLLQVMW